jgi:hypothetical protein
LRDLRIETRDVDRERDAERFAHVGRAQGPTAKEQAETRQGREGVRNPEVHRILENWAQRLSFARKFLRNFATFGATIAEQYGLALPVRAKYS